jgi:hypothetical protein
VEVGVAGLEVDDVDMVVVTVGAFPSYTMMRFDPPQTCVLFPEQGYPHAVAASDAISFLIEFPHQHSQLYSKPA